MYWYYLTSQCLSFRKPPNEEPDGVWWSIKNHFTLHHSHRVMTETRRTTKQPSPHQKIMLIHHIDLAANIVLICLRQLSTNCIVRPSPKLPRCAFQHTKCICLVLAAQRASTLWTYILHLLISLMSTKWNYYFAVHCRGRRALIIVNEHEQGHGVCCCSCWCDGKVTFDDDDYVCYYYHYCDCRCSF